MSDTTSKILRIVLAILLAVSFAVTIWFYLTASDIESGLDAEKKIELFGPVLEYFLVWTYGLFFAAAGGTVFFSIFQIITNPKGAVSSILPMAGFVIILIVSWVLSSDEVLYMPNYTGPGNDPATMKWSGAGLISMYILFALAMLAIVYSEVSKMLK